MPRMPIVILNEIVAVGTVVLFNPRTSLDPNALLNGPGQPAKSEGGRHNSLNGVFYK